jgi:hypothetical protein
VKKPGSKVWLEKVPNGNEPVEPKTSDAGQALFKADAHRLQKSLGTVDMGVLMCSRQAWCGNAENMVIFHVSTAAQATEVRRQRHCTIQETLVW